MKRLILIAVVCAFMSVPALAAISISYEYAIDTDLTLTTPHSGAIVDNFDSGRPGWTYTGNGQIVSGSDGMTYAPPFNNVLMLAPDATYYYSVPENMSTVWAMVDFGGPTYNYLGLFWGSIDQYNTIEFLNSGSVVTGGTITGDQVWTNGTPGSQSGPDNNLYVNFRGVPDFDAVRFTSTSYAFEFDNLAVPVPGAILLGILGLGAAGLKLRKFA